MEQLSNFLRYPSPFILSIDDGGLWAPFMSYSGHPSPQTQEQQKSDSGVNQYYGEFKKVSYLLATKHRSSWAMLVTALLIVCVCVCI